MALREERVSIHSRLLSRELPRETTSIAAYRSGFNPLPVIKPGVTHLEIGQPLRLVCFNPLPVIKPGVTSLLEKRGDVDILVSIHSRLLSRELPGE
ncbi:protein of unknown function [Methylocaldum szegediense]|uniref:Uncharacterized protein n=1 Tax=Methylocaldum szegediense TaxID=73780 RepID=A0ABM9I9B4_9GAMM|nr:protein of unknown function [Methylocaldum szegediense]